MERDVSTRIKRRSRKLSLTGAIVAMLVGVILPVLLSTTIGIVTLARGEGSESIVVGVLVICFAAAAIGGAVTVTVLLSRRARLARLQADLLSNVSHELRTPLSAIRMYAQTLLMGHVASDPDVVQESLQTIVRETEWLETMIDRLLTWRASARDRAVPKMSTGPVRDAVKEALDHFGRMIAPGEIDLSVELESANRVLHDKQGVRTIVLNLLINAYKYTHAQKKIRLGLRDRNGGVEIAVEDNGIGIPAREVGRIFDPFYRIDSRLRGKSPGAGLGLAIVHHLVRAHAGEIRVDSLEGRGSCFTIFLPGAVEKERAREG
ncbi:MAG: HAMP domain-containing histidine kinase [Deltaproteobacteria bacterium]|nr:HAMP domain-containing histidine kinase [Deltaproteobacteria bacterium]